MLFHIPLPRRPDSQPIATRQPLEHRAALREITRVEIVSPCADSRTPELQAAIDAGLVTLRVGGEYLLELGFDGELQKQKADFRPSLPLKFCW